MSLNVAAYSGLYNMGLIQPSVGLPMLARARLSRFTTAANVGQAADVPSKEVDGLVCSPPSHAQANLLDCAETSGLPVKSLSV